MDERLPGSHPGEGSFVDLYLWPLNAAMKAGEAYLKLFERTAPPDGGEPADELDWTTKNAVALDLVSMRLRDFSTRSTGPATLICAPYALHGALIADFAPGHSLVEALQRNGLPRVFVTDWYSATPEMAHLSIDSYLADLNVVVDELGPPINLVGLCQGGWLALLYAARFPGKVRRLVLAGAPVDLSHDSTLSQLVATVPLSAFESFVQLEKGVVCGQHMLDRWKFSIASRDPDVVLQVPADATPVECTRLLDRFQRWYASTLDLPGVFYLQVIRWIFKENRIARGCFVALGRPVNLAKIEMPMFLLAARDDEVVSADQLLSAASLVGTPKHLLETVVEPCSHLSLFLGARTIAGPWSRIAGWLRSDPLPP